MNRQLHKELVEKVIEPLLFEPKKQDNPFYQTMLGASAGIISMIGSLLIAHERLKAKLDNANFYFNNAMNKWNWNEILTNNRYLAFKLPDRILKQIIAIDEHVQANRNKAFTLQDIENLFKLLNNLEFDLQRVIHYKQYWLMTFPLTRWLYNRLKP